MMKSEETKNNDQAMQIIQSLYEKTVPEYLLEDHPTEIPQTAQKLIRSVGNAKGNGMQAEQLDFELVTPCILGLISQTLYSNRKDQSLLSSLCQAQGAN